MVSDRHNNEGVIMFQVADLVCFNGQTELGIITHIIDSEKLYKYIVYFIDKNHSWAYAEEELTKVSNV